MDAFGDPTLSSDLATFDSLTGLPPAILNLYFPDGVPTRRNSGWAVETALDVEWGHAIAPNATIDLVIGLDSTFPSLFDAIAFVANSLPNEAALSMSFGATESVFPTTGSFTIAAHHQLFATITSHGTTVFASSGDSGASATTFNNPQYPSSDPLVVAVGGTSLFLNADASYSSETTWSGSTSGNSSVFPKPAWQQGLPNILPGDKTRDTVDVSYDGDPATGVLVIAAGKGFQVGGTSAGSPQWAALLTLASQANSARYGAIAPRLYKLTTYHDVTTGSNGFFSGAVGWDYPTGLGSPNATATVKALATSTTLNVPLSNTGNFQGLSITTSGNLAVDTATFTFSGTATVTATNSTTGATVFTKAYTITGLRLFNGTSGLRALFLLNMAVTPYPLSSDVTVTVSGGAGTTSVSLTRQIDVNGDGTVNISDLTLVALAFSSTLGSLNYNPKADLDANGVVNIIDLTLVAIYFGAPSLT